MNTDTPRPTVVRIVLRSLVAAVGMLACAFAPVLPFLHPGYAAWMSVERDGAEGTLQLVAEIARFGIAVVAASVLLLLAARVERVRLRDYLGRVPAGRAWGVLLATSVAAAAVTGLGAGLATLTGLGLWLACRGRFGKGAWRIVRQALADGWAGRLGPCPAFLEGRAADAAPGPKAKRQGL